MALTPYILLTELKSYLGYVQKANVASYTEPQWEDEKEI